MTRTREVLVDGMPGLYAVGEVEVNGAPYYVAASENRGGRVVLVDARTKEQHALTGGQGGVMAAIPDGDGKLLFIEEFYPVFDSATAKVIAVDLELRGKEVTAVGRSVRLEAPYVHRIGLLKEADGTFLAVGKLCLHKDDPDDWSTAGFMEIAPHRDRAGNAADAEAAKRAELVQGGVWKHHAMFICPGADGYDTLFFGGTEGVFRTVRRGSTWETERLIDMPTSDIVFTDLDGDGRPELAVIEQFHGDLAVVYREKDGAWERQVEIPLNFGHVLWGGSFLGRPALIAGSRGGEKKLVLYRFASEDEVLKITEEQVIDEGQAPAQILVDEHGARAEVIAANHGAAQLVRYSFAL